MDQLCLRFCKGTTSIYIKDKMPAPNVSVIQKFHCIIITWLVWPYPSTLCIIIRYCRWNYFTERGAEQLQETVRERNSRGDATEVELIVNDQLMAP